ncbi:MAG: NYN domain-containing protein [Planctomycetes bacterium]|nr:NYN domain-containing protein [Planctomycetota bacterium]
MTNEIQLCRTLDRYFSMTSEEGEVVFDGAGPPDKSEFDSVGRLSVVFSGFHSDADTVIEEKVAASTSPRRLTVVSNDRRLRQTVAARKAATVKSDQFWSQVLNELRRDKPAVKEPEEKRDGLTDGETEQWLDLFGLDD